MKIAVIGANGKAGRLIVEEADIRGIDTTAIVRSENKSVAKHVIEKDLFDLTKEDVVGFDVLVNSFAVWQPELYPKHIEAIKHLSNLLRGSERRLIVVGGAGSLFLDESYIKTLSDSEGFPEEFKGLADAMRESLDVLKKEFDVNWTYISPAADFDAEGEKTGKYIKRGEVFSVNEKGESRISYADYATAFVDEIENGQHIKERISLLGE